MNARRERSRYENAFGYSPNDATSPLKQWSLNIVQSVGQGQSGRIQAHACLRGHGHSPELPQARVADRVNGGGHSNPLDAIIRRYPHIISELASAIEIAGRSYVLDNSDERSDCL